MNRLGTVFPTVSRAESTVVRVKSIGFQHLRYASTAGRGFIGSDDNAILSNLWRRIPLKSVVSPGKEPFLMSRHKKSVDYLGLNMRRINRVHQLTYKEKSTLPEPVQEAVGAARGMATKLFLALNPLGPNFPREHDEWSEGTRTVGMQILEALRTNHLDSLIPLCADPSILDVHSKQLYALSKEQKLSFQVSESDFIGQDGVIYSHYDSHNLGSLDVFFHSIRPTVVSATGKELDQIQMVYRLRMGFLRKRNLLYKMVKSFPLSESQQQVHKVLIPKDYGFRAPRYLCLTIDLCQNIEEISKWPLPVSELMLYDFEVHSF